MTMKASLDVIPHQSEAAAKFAAMLRYILVRLLRKMIKNGIPAETIIAEIHSVLVSFKSKIKFISRDIASKIKKDPEYSEKNKRHIESWAFWVGYYKDYLLVIKLLEKHIDKDLIKLTSKSEKETKITLVLNKLILGAFKKYRKYSLSKEDSEKSFSLAGLLLGLVVTFHTIGKITAAKQFLRLSKTIMIRLKIRSSDLIII